MSYKIKIPMVNLSKNYQGLQKEIDQSVSKIFRKGQFILGENVSLFEKEFSRYLGVKYAIGVASGTDALILALKSLGINSQDEVIVPANSYPTALAVASVATPKLVDIDPRTLNMDISKIEKTITPKTRAILPVHLFGLAAEMRAILKIAKKHRLFVIEDAAQAHGASYEGKKLGTLGDLGCFSFYPTKNLGCCGDGGMVVTNNKKLAELIRQLRVYGEKKRYQSLRLGINSRLDELQAGILRVKLKRLDSYNQLRQKVAYHYFSCLKSDNLILPPKKSDGSHVYHLFTIRARERDNLKRYLEKHGIETNIHYPLPVHLVKAFSFLKYQKGDFPEAEKACREILSLPCYPELTNKQITSICNLLKSSLK